MKINYILFFISLIFFSCSNEQVKPKVFTGDKQYHTTDPSRLFFYNIRSTNYFKVRKPHTRIDIYTLRKFSRDNKRPILYPTIVNNWMQDEAYVFIEKNNYVSYGDTLMVKWESDSLSGQFYLDIPNKQKQYTFAEKIYESIKSKHRLFVQTEKNGFVPLFENIQDRTNFMITMRDYYKLTERK